MGLRKKCPRVREYLARIKILFFSFPVAESKKEVFMEIARKNNEGAQCEKLEIFWQKVKTVFRKLPARITGVIIGWSSTITFIQYFEIDPIFETFCWVGVALVFSEASVKALK